MTTPYPERWLIIADDLTGAADCAIAFARHGRAASVSWNVEALEDSVVAVDADSRRMAPAEAAAHHLRLLEARHAPGIGLFKKIDSTLRGQPAAELAATIRLLRASGHGALSIVAPAFPETGRTLQEGGIHLHGTPLERTPLWARDHSYPTANVVAVLEAEGLQVRHAGLDVLRAGSLGGLVRDAVVDGIDAVVCDAGEPGDLDLVAEATLPLASQLFWTGSGGLAQALARAGAGTAEAAIVPIDVTGGILFVVGSIAEASRAAAAVLAADQSVTSVGVTPDLLRKGESDAGWRSAADHIAATLEAERDVLVEITAEAGADLSQGADLARRLATLLRPAAPQIGAIFATGGETALALLDALGITGIRLIEEIEPGVPLGVTRGALTVPVVTKAGAFGDAETLRHCLSHLRRLRHSENRS